MLQSISWAEYFTAIALLGGSYYLVLFGARYKGKIKEVASRQLERKTLAQHEAAEQEDDAFAELEAVVEMLRECMLEAAQGISKEELLVQLKERLINYGGLRLAAYQDALNYYIIEFASEQCGVSFSDSELSAAWKTLPRN